MFAPFTSLTSRQLLAWITLTCEFGVALLFTMCTSSFTLKWTWKRTYVHFHVYIIYIKVKLKVNEHLLLPSLHSLNSHIHFCLSKPINVFAYLTFVLFLSSWSNRKLVFSLRPRQVWNIMIIVLYKFYDFHFWQQNNVNCT